MRAWSLVITPATCCPVISVSPSTLPNAAAGIAYNQTIAGSGGTGPYTFSITAGTLPNGLTLSSAGSLSGTPIAPGLASFTITAVDANGCIGSQAYSLSITAGITSFTPDHGNTNTRVLINGVGFTGVSSVTFNGQPAASFAFLSDMQVRAIVPAGATTGKIGLTTPAGTTSSLTNFTIVAQNNRTFVSTQGSDVNGCSPTQPCRSFSRALDATFYGGEIVVLKSGGYGPTTIDKAVTIVSPDGVYAGITASGANGITINATPGDVIMLRGLTLNGVAGATNGIQVTNGAAVELNNMVISGFATGISAIGAERVHLYDSLIRGSTLKALDISTTSGTTFALLDQMRLEDNLQAIAAGDGARVMVRRSQIVGKGSIGSGVMANSAAGSAEVTLERASISNTGTALQAGATAQSIIRISRSMITGNTVGVLTTGSGVVGSLGNNTLDGNGMDGTFTPLTAK